MPLVRKPDGRALKRQRVGLACEKCRALKAKCDGQQPECGRCKGYGFTCTWLSSRKRNHHTSTDGRAQHAESDAKHDGHVACSYIVKSYEALNRSLQPKLDQGDQVALDLTLASIRQRLPDELGDQAQRVESSEKPESPSEERSPTYVGRASDLYFFKTIESCMGGDDLSKKYYDQTDIPEKTTFLGRPLLCPSQEEGSRYLDIYFSTIHVAYPFLCRALVCAQFQQMWVKKSKVNEHQDRSMLAVLNFIFAIGSYYLSFPHDENPSSQSHFQYFEQAVYFSDELMAQCSLVNVWASLLRCFFLLAICQTDRCWNTLGFAIRMGQSIGLHVETSPPRRGLSVSIDTECELRRRTWYSMYVLDRLLALQLGRPMAIRQADFHVALPSRENMDADSDDTMVGNLIMDYFLHVIHFSSIVEEVIQELYQPIQPEISADQLLLNASAIDSSLLRWRSSLPHHLRFDLGHTFEKTVVFQRQRNMLAVKFHHLRALIHRPFLALPRLPHHSDAFMASLSSDRTEIQAAEKKCIYAAQQTARLLHNVADERSLVQDFPWWQMISCLICAGSILFVADVFCDANKRSNEFSGYLHEDANTCLKVFRALSVQSPAAKQAVGMLQSLAHLRSVSGVTPRAPDSSTPRGTHTEAFSAMSMGSLALDFPPDSLTDLDFEWPSEISNSMEWSIHVLDNVNNVVNPRADK